MSPSCLNLLSSWDNCAQLTHIFLAFLWQDFCHFVTLVCPWGLRTHRLGRDRTFVLKRGCFFKTAPHYPILDCGGKVEGCITGARRVGQISKGVNKFFSPDAMDLKISCFVSLETFEGYWTGGTEPGSAIWCNSNSTVLSQGWGGNCSRLLRSQRVRVNSTDIGSPEERGLQSHGPRGFFQSHS